MVIRLYDETPMHRDNFKKLAADGFYDGTTFHRVIHGFMIQGGDPNSRDDNPDNDGQGGPGYTTPQEIQPGLLHKKGALAAARSPDQFNPEKASNGSQFYIVHGTTFGPEMRPQFEAMARQQFRNMTFAYSEGEWDTYTTLGGYPSLDGGYTVFGELVEGFDVLDQVAQAPTPTSTSQPGSRNPNRPLENITMTVTPVKN